MDTFVVVETHDVFHYAFFSLAPRLIFLVKNDPLFNDTMERLDTGIIVTVAFSTHTCDELDSETVDGFGWLVLTRG